MKRLLLWMKLWADDQCLVVADQVANRSWHSSKNSLVGTSAVLICGTVQRKERCYQNLIELFLLEAAFWSISFSHRVRSSAFRLPTLPRRHASSVGMMSYSMPMWLCHPCAVLKKAVSASTVMEIGSPSGRYQISCMTSSTLSGDLLSRTLAA